MKKFFIAAALLLSASGAMAQTGMWVGVKNIQMEKKSKKVEFSFKAEYPFTEDSVSANAIREWINESLGGTYTGSLMDYNQMLTYYADRTIQGYADAEVEEGWGPSEESYEFKRGHETANIITYCLSQYTYSSGAPHGFYLDSTATFRKSDGRRFGWDMFTFDGKTRLKAILARRLRTDYGDDTFFKVPDASDPSFELPSHAPHINADGVVFTYPPYEIAPFAAGFITVTLPFTMVKGMLNATGQTYL